jgi:glycosyltransferase involved in cell wall biosynthesis
LNSVFMRKTSVAVFHPRLGRGGSEAAAMWTLEALKRDYRIAIVAGGRIDLPALNRFYGTSIEPDECETVEIALPWPLAKAEWGAVLRAVLVDRGRRRHLGRFDVLINSYNIGNFDRPGIHLLADFSWDDEMRRRLDPSGNGLAGAIHRDGWTRRAYLGAAAMVSAASARDPFAGGDLIVANSEWSKELLRERHGIEARVLYPPVTMRMPATVPERKVNRFVCLGRIEAEKRIERIIGILKGVRARGHDLSLHIIGGTGETAYGRSIERLSRAEGGWIALEGRQFGEAKARLLAESAYGIHARAAEPFGIAVAEMVAAGCIVFAPAEGGPAEILGHDALLYRTEDEAVEKISAVLNSGELQARLRAHLRRQAENFSVESFMRGIRRVVKEFIAKQASRESLRVDPSTSRTPLGMTES